MPNKNKALGDAFERRVVARALKHGLSASKQPQSGMLSAYPNDIVVEGLLGECKVRTTHPSFNELDGYLEGAEANAKRAKMRGAFLVYNNKGSRHPRVLIDLELFLSILEKVTLDTVTESVS